MENKLLPKEFKTRRVFFIILLIAIPFITFLFWVLKGHNEDQTNNETDKGKRFNFELPIPQFKEDSSYDKMSYYDQAAMDSLKLVEQRKKDPNFSNNLFRMDSLQNNDDFYNSRGGKTALNTFSRKSSSEEKIYEKLGALQNAIKEPSISGIQQQDMREFENYGSSSSEEIKNMERMMAAMSQPQEPDQELQQLGGMLESILDIQHPSRVQEKLKQSADNRKGKIYNVDKKSSDNDITVLQSIDSSKMNKFNSNSFFDLENRINQDELQNSIQGVIHETQIIINGSVVKIRLSDDIVVQGKLIPKSTFVFGQAVLKGERLEVKISAIRYQNSILPVDLSVYDLDGLSGIYIPGAVNRDVAKASADRSIQTMGLSGLDDSWGAQAAGMGIEAAKSLMSKKVKLVKVVVKAGYQVLLYDEKNKK